MMIHVNPFDTGFDENSHVMKFSAVARDITTTTHAPPKFVVRRPDLPPSSFSASTFASEASSTATTRPAIPKEMLATAPAKAQTTMRATVKVPVVEVSVEGKGEKEGVEGGLLGVVGTVSPRESEVEWAVVVEELMAAVEGESCLSLPDLGRAQCPLKKETDDLLSFAFLLRRGRGGGRRGRA